MVFLFPFCELLGASETWNCAERNRNRMIKVLSMSGLVKEPEDTFENDAQININNDCGHTKEQAEKTISMGLIASVFHRRLKNP
jgi:hypothetical protein